MKKALLTTTALVALNSAAFASSVDTPVNSASSTHHTHNDATIVWSGDANIKYNVPLVKTTVSQVAVGAVPAGTISTSKADGTVKSDVDLDVTMTSRGAYSATISADISTGSAANLGANATISVTTPFFNVSVGKDDASGGAGGGADASDLFADIDHMTNIGADEDTSDWYVSLPNFGGWTIAASGELDPGGSTTSTSYAIVDGAAVATTTTKKHSEMTSIGLKGTVGGLSITAGGMHKNAGASVSTSLMGATVKIAAASVFSATKNKNVQEQGVQVDMPLGGMTLSANSTTVDGTSNWGASVSTTMGGFAVSAGTDSDEDSQFSISGPMGPVTFVLDYDTDKLNTNGTDAKDATIEAGVTYAVPGTTGTTISASYSNDPDEDNFDNGTQVKMAFKF